MVRAGFTRRAGPSEHARAIQLGSALPIYGGGFSWGKLAESGMKHLRKAATTAGTHALMGGLSSLAAGGNFKDFARGALGGAKRGAQEEGYNALGRLAKRYMPMSYEEEEQ